MYVMQTTLIVCCFFSSILPLLETAICEAWIAKKEGRKIFVEAELRSVDGQTIYDTCSLLWLDMSATIMHRTLNEKIESKY